MLVYWYSKLISPYTGTGPWWDYGVDQYSLKGMCLQTYWWQSIPIVAYGANPCVPPGWFLIACTKITFILPALIYVIYKLPSHGFRTLYVSFFVGCSIALSSTRMLRQTVVKDDDFSSYGVMLFGLMMKFRNTGYMVVWNRLGMIAVGCLIGF